MTPLELLAPARSADVGIAAIRCGADAVYIGGPAFGARAAAGNPVEEIERLCSFAKAFGVRIYVTVNTLAKDEEERGEIVRLMRSLRGKGVSAFILQDTSLMELLEREGEWEEEFHASTQCTILDGRRAAQLAQMGFSRLILERQLSLGQIRAIRAATPPAVQLEAFVHGALCVCYSGACYLSEYLSGRSANRGECSQPCRSRYDLIDSSGRVIVRDRPLLSLKDLCLLERVEDLAREGISSFKIEGRLKNESYVKNVVRAYDKALRELVDKYPDKYCRSSAGVCSGGFTPDVNKTFNRGYTTLFLDGVRGDWLSGEAAKSMGEKVGKLRATLPGYIDVCTGGSAILHNGDGLCVTGRSGQVEGFRADRVETLSPGVQRVFCKGSASLREGAALWRNFDSSFERSLQGDLPRRLVSREVILEITDSCATLLCGDISVTLPLPDGTEISTNQERMRGIISDQIGKTSLNQSFSLRRIRCAGALPLLSASFINSLRRALAEKLESSAGVRSAGGKARAVCLSEGRAPTGELMRSKYCIRYQLGICPAHPRDGAPEVCGRLFLRNNGRLLELRFDCAECEMTVLSPSGSKVPR